MVWNVFGYTLVIAVAIFYKQYVNFGHFLFGEDNPRGKVYYKNKIVAKIMEIFMRIFFFFVGVRGLISLWFGK